MAIGGLPVTAALVAICHRQRHGSGGELSHGEGHGTEEIAGIVGAAGYTLLVGNDEIGGGDKAKMNAYLDVADVGYNSFATPELKSVLSELHLDYHPAVIKLFHRLGKLCGNDSIAKTNAPTGTKQNAADILYGNNSQE